MLPAVALCAGKGDCPGVSCSIAVHNWAPHAWYWHCALVWNCSLPDQKVELTPHPVWPIGTGWEGFSQADNWGGSGTYSSTGGSYWRCRWIFEHRGACTLPWWVGVGPALLMPVPGQPEAVIVGTEICGGKTWICGDRTIGTVSQL